MDKQKRCDSRGYILQLDRGLKSQKRQSDFAAPAHAPALGIWPRPFPVAGEVRNQSTWGSEKVYAGRKREDARRLATAGGDLPAIARSIVVFEFGWSWIILCSAA